MKQIFDWLREQIMELADYNGNPYLDSVDVLDTINEAEAKWEAEDIPIIHGKAELELHDKEIRAKAIDEQPTAYDVEKVERQIKDYFCNVIDACEEDIIPHDSLEYSKAICEIVRKGGVE